MLKVDREGYSLYQTFHAIEMGILEVIGDKHCGLYSMWTTSK